MRNFFMGFIFVGLFLSTVPSARAESQAACSIWLCLPGGFPSGCAAAYSEFKHRIEKGRPPLPDLASCVVGEDREKAEGRYEMGIEYFMPCRAGFEIYEYIFDGKPRGICWSTNPKCSLLGNIQRSQDNMCKSYDAARRAETHFIKLWVDGNFLGQFFYD